MARKTKDQEQEDQYKQISDNMSKLLQCQEQEDVQKAKDLRDLQQATQTSQRTTVEANSSILIEVTVVRTCNSALA